MKQAAPTLCAPPAPALVVIAGGAGEAGWPAVAAAPDAKLLKALPAAGRVLEVGPGSAAMARAYKQAHASAHWTAVDLVGDEHAPRRDSVDAWCELGGLATLPAGSFDLLVVNEVLPWLPDPLPTLRQLARLAAPGAKLLLNVENHASLATLERLLDADLSAETRQSPALGQPRLQSPATVYKLLMDAGWMPTLADGHAEPAAAGSTRATLKALAQASGLAAGCPERVHALDRLVIEARATFAGAPVLPGAARFTVLVPTTHERQLRVNVEQSPGLKEVGARIVSYRGATSPAQALEQGLAHADADWVLLCHQDVYFPAGFGEQLNAILAGIPAAERPRTLIGFIGLGALAGGQGTAASGFVIDRLHRADHPASAQATSIDEVALVVSRDTIHRIDPAMGWHLWATDLCLQSICQHGVFPRIVRAPLFHNSRTGWTLPSGFSDAAHKLAAKWGEGFGPIPTLCGVIDAAFLASHPRTPA
jgi:ubiquinone/menaquinone biosynthesis C-methylase UbiE